MSSTSFASASAGRTRDFLTVGSMGHASQIALGIALARPDRKACASSTATARRSCISARSPSSESSPRQPRHVLFNNRAHDSVGGQPTAAFEIDLTAIAKACGYRTALVARTTGEILAALETVKKADGPALLEIRVNAGARADLGRPSASPADNKVELMEYLRA